MRRRTPWRSTVVGLALSCSLILATRSEAADPPIPEFLGVYAVVNGQLVEMHPLPGSSDRERQQAIQLGMGGGDLLKGSSGLVIEDPNVNFVIYKNGASEVTSFFLEIMKSVEYAFQPSMVPGYVSDQLQKVDWGWVGAQTGYTMRVAPIAKNPEMMVRVVPPIPLPPGRYGLSFNSMLYDFQVGLKETETCLVRAASAMGGVTYTECTEFFAKHPGAHRDSASRTGASGDPRGVAADATPYEWSGLLWTPSDNGSNISQAEAELYCQGLTLGGFSDWRLPSVVELEGLYDESSTKKYKTRGSVEVGLHGVWSADLKGSASFLGWYFNFNSGAKAWANRKSGARALCVRSAGDL